MEKSTELDGKKIRWKKAPNQMEKKLDGKKHQIRWKKNLFRYISEQKSKNNENKILKR